MFTHLSIYLSIYLSIFNQLYLCIYLYILLHTYIIHYLHTYMHPCIHVRTYVPRSPEARNCWQGAAEETGWPKFLGSERETSPKKWSNMFHKYGYTVWVNTYRYIFSGMNIHLPAILGFTRVPRFWHTAIYQTRAKDKCIPKWANIAANMFILRIMLTLTHEFPGGVSWIFRDFSGPVEKPTESRMWW